MLLASKLAPALAVGNALILTSAAQAPLFGYPMAELVRDIFPAGVVAVQSGERECGEALISHPLARKVSLVGSTGTGKRSCAKRPRRSCRLAWNSAARTLSSCARISVSTRRSPG